jgi:hypothetical protein
MNKVKGMEKSNHSDAELLSLIKEGIECATEIERLLISVDKVLKLSMPKALYNTTTSLSEFLELREKVRSFLLKEYLTSDTPVVVSDKENDVLIKNMPFETLKIIIDSESFQSIKTSHQKGMFSVSIDNVNQV